MSTSTGRQPTTISINIDGEPHWPTPVRHLAAEFPKQYVYNQTEVHTRKKRSSVLQLVVNELFANCWGQGRTGIQKSQK